MNCHAETERDNECAQFQHLQKDSILLYRFRIQTRTTNHAWLWILRDDGIWFWIDPTWTDNLGYVVYGYVSGGEEIQCRPDPQYCVIYPESLKNLPYAPAMGTRITRTGSGYGGNSSYSSSRSSSEGNSSGWSDSSDWSDSYSNSSESGGYFSVGFTGVLDFSKTSEILGNFVNFDKFGLQFGFESPSDESIFMIFLVEYLCDHLETDDDGFYDENKELSDAVLIGLDLGFPLLTFFQPYGGGSIGIQKTGGWENNPLFSWKVNGGIRFAFSSFCVRLDVSYSRVLKSATTIALGF